MSASDPIRGNQAMTFGLSGPNEYATFAQAETDNFGASLDNDFSADVKAIVLAGEDADDSDLTYAEVSGGAQVDTITITGIQSLKAGSLWRYLWTNPGAKVAGSYIPTGNSDDGIVRFFGTLGLRPSLGGEARRSKERFDFETVIDVEQLELFIP